VAKQAPLFLHPETTTPPDAFGRDQRTERRHNRAARRKSKEIDKKRWLRKLSAKFSRDMREMTMPIPGLSRRSRSALMCLQRVSAISATAPSWKGVSHGSSSSSLSSARGDMLEIGMIFVRVIWFGWEF
jgi:hypothetical protein